MRNRWITVADVVLGTVGAALVINEITDQIEVPLWLSVPLCGVVAAVLIALHVFRGGRVEGFTPRAKTEIKAQALHGIAIAADKIPGPITVIQPLPSIAPQTLPSPFQVPRDIPHFVGRDEEMATLEETLVSGRIAAVCGVTGMAGIGKSALAAHFASLRRGLFPDGVLYASLRDSEPLAILASFATTYGLDVSQYPDLPSRAAAVRTILSKKRAMVILDNAEDIQAVRALLPCCGELCAAIVTTRDKELASAVTDRVVPLPFLTDSESLDLLERLVGKERSQAQRGAARQVSTLLGNLPLALEMAGKLAKLRGWEISELYTHLEDERSRMDLHVKDLQVRTSFNLSYDLLNDKQRTVFAGLGAFLGLSFDATAAGVVAGVENVEKLLVELCDLSLLQQQEGGRFRQHALLADFAREKLRQEGIEELVYGKHARHYLAVAQRESDRLQRAGTLVNARRVFETDYPQMRTGQTWAVRAGQNEMVVRYAVALWGYLDLTGLYQEAVKRVQAGLRITQRLQWKSWESSLLSKLGIAYSDLGKMQEAIEYLEQALAIDQHLGDRQREGVSLGSLGKAYAVLGKVPEAKDCFESALNIARQVGDEWREEAWLGSLGLACYRSGDFKTAAEYCREALSIARRIGDRRGEASKLGKLGMVHFGWRKLETAARCFESAATILHEIGDYRDKAAWSVNLGLTYYLLGHIGLARRAWESALAHFKSYWGQAWPMYSSAAAKLGLAVSSPEWANRVARRKLVESILTACQDALSVSAAQGMVREFLREHVRPFQETGVAGLGPIIRLLEAKLSQD